MGHRPGRGRFASGRAPRVRLKWGAYDLGEKLESYRATPSIREILLVEAESVDVHHTFRDGDGWQSVRHRATTDVIRLQICDATLSLDELYDTLPEST